MAKKPKPEPKIPPPPAPPVREVNWRAAEYEYAEKDVLWYVIVGFVGLLLVLFALWQKNFFFAVFIAIAVSVLIAMNRKRPPIVAFRVTEEGVGVGKQFFPYERLERFSLREREGRLNELIIMKKTMVTPFVKIPVDAQSAAQARTILAEKLPEVEYKESLVDLIAEWLGF